MPMVREVNWAGPCIDRGALVRETKQFYVYTRGAFEERVKKTNLSIHLEPCTRCVDHPKTTYPNGYDL